MFDNNKLGEIRPNQLITTFGPGAIVDAVKDSVTILDLNYWKEKGKKIIDGRLASYLNVDCFYMPRHLIVEIFRQHPSLICMYAPVSSAEGSLMSEITSTWTGT